MQEPSNSTKARPETVHVQASRRETALRSQNCGCLGEKGTLNPKPYYYSTEDMEVENQGANNLIEDLSTFFLEARGLSLHKTER